MREQAFIPSQKQRAQSVCAYQNLNLNERREKMRSAKSTVSLMLFFAVYLSILQPAKADTYFDDGGTWEINYHISGDVRVKDSSGGDPTTVTLLSGGRIGDELKVQNNSYAMMTGGSVADLETYAGSQATMTGGTVRDDIEVHGESELTLSGGTIGDELFAGWYHEYPDSVTLTIKGTGFAIDGNPVPYGEYFTSDYTRGHITGTLANGDPLDNDFQIWHDSALVLAVPEPTTLLLLGMGGLLLRRYRLGAEL